jgi:MFS family permease
MAEWSANSQTPAEKTGRIPIPPALKSPTYRRYFTGAVGAVFGHQMFMFGQLWLIHEMTGSALYLGFVGLANAIPAITLNLFGGVSADRFERRRLVMLTQYAAAAGVALLAVPTLLGVAQPWHVLVVAALVSGIGAFNLPARMSLYPHYVERESLMSAIALNSGLWQGGRIVAPAIAGGLIVWVGTGWTFVVAGAGLALLAVVLHTLPNVQPEKTGKSALKDIVEGFRYLKTNSTIALLIGMVFFNSFFGLAYIIMMPVFAVDILDVGATGQGYLLSASGIGSLLTTLYLTTRETIERTGRVIIISAIIAGSSLVAFSLTAQYIGWMPLSLLLIMFVGAFNSGYLLLTVTSLQMVVPEKLRGRVMGFYGMTWNILPLGGMWTGFLSGFVGVATAVALGGFAVIGFAVIAAIAGAGLWQLSVSPSRRAEDAERSIEA